MADAFARRLRREQTPAEKFFWKKVRDRRFDGFKIRRQVPMGVYIVDFACFERRVIFELNGNVHLESKEYDRHRTNWLTSDGWKVHRFTNEEVMQEWNAVEEAVWNALNGIEPPKSPGLDALEAERVLAPSPLTPLPQGERGT
jgi:very-short-patch-repair endonuclease